MKCWLTFVQWSWRDVAEPRWDVDTSALCEYALHSHSDYQVLLNTDTDDCLQHSDNDTSCNGHLLKVGNKLLTCWELGSQRQTFTI